MAGGRVTPGRLLLLVLALNLLAAIAPFRLELPETVDNHLQERADGALLFSAPSIARTAAPPRWVADARASGEIAVSLHVTPTFSEQSGPARIVSFSHDYLSHNLVIGQDRSDLVIRLRRPGSGADGQPAFVVANVFAAGRSSDILVRVRDAQLQVEVDGRAAIETTLPERPLSTWSDSYRLALGNEVLGLRPWNGRIERAVVTTPAFREDLLAPGVLEKPAQWWQVPSRLRVAFGFAFPDDVLPTLLHFLAFMPVGYAALQLRAMRGKWVLVVLLVLPLAVGVEGAKILFEARHPTIWNMLANWAGGLAGAIALPRFLRLRGKRG